MGLFDWFKPRKKNSSKIFNDDGNLIMDFDESFENHVKRKTEEFIETDYLGKAAEARSNAKDAIKEGKNDKAWKFLHEQQSYYLQHANENKFTKKQSFELISTIHKEMANILRREGKHKEALANIVYWAACSDRQKSEQEKKIPAYFNRAKFNSVTISDLTSYITKIKGNPDYREIQNKINQWSTKSC